MSFVRPAKVKFPQPPAVGVKHKKPKKKMPPSWDNTVSDLTVLKASPEEIFQRKESHKSKNSDVVRLEKTRQVIAKAMVARNDELAKGSEKKKTALLKEVLHDQAEIQDVLARSDKAISMVRDLFADNPKRFTGFPNVTVAPGQSVIERPDGTLVPEECTLLPQSPNLNTSQLEKLSEQVMDAEALNEVDPDDASMSAKDDAGFCFQPRFNLSRFQQFLQQEKASSLTLKHLDPMRYSTSPSGNSTVTLQGSEQTIPERDMTVMSPTKATPVNESINVSGRVKKTKNNDKENRRKKNYQKETVDAPEHMNDLRKVLGRLENEIYDYERQAGHTDTNQEKKQTDTFSGYTIALVDAVSRLTCLLRQRDAKLHAEMTIREQLSEDVQHLHGLVDALTVEVIKSHESQMNLNVEFQEFKQMTLEEFKKMMIQPHANSKNNNSPHPVPVHQNSEPASPKLPDAKQVLPPVLDEAVQHKEEAPTQTPASSESLMMPSAMPVIQSASSSAAHVVTVPKPTPLVQKSSTSSADLQRQIAELSAEHQRAQSRILQLQNLNQALNKITVPEPQRYNISTLKKPEKIYESDATEQFSDDDVNGLNVEFQTQDASPLISPILNGNKAQKITVSIPSIDFHSLGEPLSPKGERGMSPLSEIEVCFED